MSNNSSSPQTCLSQVALFKDQVWHRLAGNPASWQPAVISYSPLNLTVTDFICLAKHLFSNFVSTVALHIFSNQRLSSWGHLESAIGYQDGVLWKVKPSASSYPAGLL